MHVGVRHERLVRRLRVHDWYFRLPVVRPLDEWGAGLSVGVGFGCVRVHRLFEGGSVIAVAAVFAAAAFSASFAASDAVAFSATAPSTGSTGKRVSGESLRQL